MKKNVFLSAVALLTLATSCTTEESLYSWYNYDNSAYKYQKELTPSSRKAYVEQLEKMEKKQNGQRGVVPPGFYAEYGFLLYNDNQQELGLQYMKKEVELYPESQLFIGGIIKRIEK